MNPKKTDAGGATFYRELPNFETLRMFGARYPQFEFSAIESAIHLMRLGDNLNNAFEEFLQGYGLSKGRFMILMMLLRAPDVAQTPATLSEACGVTRATVTGLLDTLETAGFVRRVPDPVDRRSLRVEITDDGRKRVEEMLPEHYRRIAEVMGDVTGEERAQLVAILRKIWDRLHCFNAP